MARTTFDIIASTEGLDELIRNVRDPQTLADPLTWGMQRSGFAVQGAMQEESPVGADGRMRNSINTVIDKRQPFPLFARVGPSVAYAVYNVLGTRPHWPPWGQRSALRRWVRLVVRPPAGELVGVTYRIARRISQRGTRANDWPTRAFKASLPKLTLIWRDVSDRIGKRITRG